MKRVSWSILIAILGTLFLPFSAGLATSSTGAVFHVGLNFVPGSIIRFYHHERRGLGPKCHADLEQDWKTPAGQALVN